MAIPRALWRLKAAPRATRNRVVWQRFHEMTSAKIIATRKRLKPVMNDLRERAVREFRRLWHPPIKGLWRPRLVTKAADFDEDAWFDSMEIASVLGDVYREFGPSSVKDGGTLGVAGARRAGAKIPDALRFDLDDPKVVAELEVRSSRFVTNVDDGTKEILRRVLARKDLEGASIDEMVEAIEDSIAFSTARAERIARTEVIGASNAGALLGYVQAEVEKKVWLKDPDFSRIRPEHLEVDDAPIPVVEPFIVGGEEMMHPGDQSASPGLVINCLCALGAYVEGS